MAERNWAAAKFAQTRMSIASSLTPRGRAVGVLYFDAQAQHPSPEDQVRRRLWAQWRGNPSPPSTLLQQAIFPMVSPTLPALSANI